MNTTQTEEIIQELNETEMIEQFKDRDYIFEEEMIDEVITPITELQNKLNFLKTDERYQNDIQLIQDIYLRSIEEDNELKLDEYKDKDIDPSFIAGFIDGDGYVHMKESKGSIRYGIFIGQCRTNILQVLHYHFYGHIYKINDETRNEIDENMYYLPNNIRTIYTIRQNSYYSKYLIEYIEDFIILKHNQIKCIYEALQIKDEIKDHTIKEKMIELKNKCQQYNQREIKIDYDFTRLNDAYIAGLFDAEGCVTIKHKGIREFRLKIGICQKNHPMLLEKLIEYFGYGIIDRYCYIIFIKDDIANFLERVLPFIIVKKNQVIVILKFLKLYRELNNNDVMTLYEICKRILNREKHMNEDIVIPENLPHSKFLERVDEEFVDILPSGDKVLKEQYKIKSERMSGERNHNYQKSFTESHIQKQKVSITKKLRKNKEALSDENIEIIRQKRMNGIKQSDIIEEFKENGMELSRDNIRKITNGTLFTIRQLEEDSRNGKVTKKEKAKGISHAQSTSLGKRQMETSLNFHERIEIILMKRDIINKSGDKFLELSNYSKQTTEIGKRKRQLGIPLMQEYLTNKFAKNVSEHIIKNLWDGRTLLFEFEFEKNTDVEITFEQYNEIIQMKIK